MSFDPRVLVVPAALAASVSACASDPTVCDRARDLVAECTGKEPPPPPEGCVGTYAEAAERTLELGCAATGGGKFDENSWYCQPDYLWLHLCEGQPLAEAAAVASLAEVCSGRDDALCRALREHRYDDARTAVRAAIGADAMAHTDPAIRYYIRERITSLFAWRVVGGARSGFAEQADALLAEHYPAYPAGSFVMARAPVAPLPARTCTSPTEALLVYPGVVRLTRRDEFSPFIEAARRELPCLEVIRVETGSFVDAGVNATIAMRAVQQLDARLGRRVPLHLLGYSQGALNALRTLVDHGEVASRVRTVVTMNAASRGSEVADLLSGLLGELGNDACASWPVLVRPVCEWAANLAVIPGEYVMRLIAAAMGVPVDDLAAFIAAEDGIAASPTLRDFLVNHRPGVESLTTDDAAKFWSTRASTLPRTALYVSFRAVISDERNLPPSNALFAALLERVDAYRPWNDMQVRLVNQSLGGPVAGVEVVERVAEGNHWQWQLTEDAVPASVMDPELVRRTPEVDMLLAHYQALQDAGLVLGD